MRKFDLQRMLLVVVAGIAIGATAAHAGSGFYIGVGGSRTFASIDDGSIADIANTDLSVDFDDAYGFNARLGFRLMDLLALELNFDYLPGFDAGKSLTVFNIPADVDASLDVTTVMVDAKLIPLRIGPAELRLFGGLGVMRADLEGSARTALAPASFDLSADDTLGCGELGLGIGLWLGENVALGVEGSYVAGFGDFADQDYAIDYFLLTAGIDFYF